MKIKVLLVVLAVTALMGEARADTVPITGTAFQLSAAAESFTFTGTGISVFSTTFDFLSELTLNCTPGAVCNMTIPVASCGNFESLSGCVVFQNAAGSVGGLFANALGGALVFTGSALIPATNPPNNTLTIPVTLSGDILGYNLTLAAGQLPPPVWELMISGTGEANFFGANPGSFTDVTYTFTGTAIPTPEPATLLLLGTGFLAFSLRRKRR